ncbi:MAG: flavodoxin family protein [Chloroflexota bacterium]
MSIRIVGISSSPRHANTELLVKHALAAAAEKYDAETEFISFKGKRIHPCVDCKACTRRHTQSLATQCTAKDDWGQLIRPLIDPVPDGVIIGSPVYFFDVNSALRAYMERCTSLFKACWQNDYPFPAPDFSRTAAGALAIGFHRHGGQETAIGTITNWFLISGFVVIGSANQEEGPVGYNGGSAWRDADGVGGPDAVLNDEWGLRAARVVGERVGRTAQLLAAGARALATVPAVG